MTKEPCMHDKRVLCSLPKSPIFMKTELYMYEKRALYVSQKSPICMVEELYVHDKRALYPSQKSPTCRAKEAYVRDKRGLHTFNWQACTGKPSHTTWTGPAQWPLVGNIGGVLMYMYIDICLFCRVCRALLS